MDQPTPTSDKTDARDARSSGERFAAAGRLRRWWLRALIALGLSGTMFVMLADGLVSWQTERWMVHDLNAVEDMPVALVPGTARTHQGRPNQFYRARLEEAAQLYHLGKVKGILVSGDNGSPYYNEPEAMRRDLVALGVPDRHITLDYAGFRTLDSVVRAKKVFGLDRFLIVSQRFQAKRGVFLARHHGIDAFGFAAHNPGGVAGLKIRFREVFARAMALLDLAIGRQPRFLGEPELVSLREPEHETQDNSPVASSNGNGVEEPNASVSSRPTAPAPE